MDTHSVSFQELLKGKSAFFQEVVHGRWGGHSMKKNQVNEALQLAQMISRSFKSTVNERLSSTGSCNSYGDLYNQQLLASFNYLER